MTDSRLVMFHTLALALVLSFPIFVFAADPPPGKAAAAVDPAISAMLGSAVPADRIETLSRMFRAASMPADAAKAATDLPLLAVLRPTGSADAPRYEARGIALDVVSVYYGPLRIENANVALTPSADGRSCKFEVSGSPFGGAATLEASGTIEWGSGPVGGDKLDAVYRVGGVPVESLRAHLPNRIDPSFRGVVDAHGKASGVVGEITTEDLPATPLRGDVEAKLDWQVLGRTAPVTIATNYILDDRMVRVHGGHLRWEGIDLGLKGWFIPQTVGEYDLVATMTDIDTLKVATDWNVPEQWRPVSKLSGTISLKGKPGSGLMRYEAKAPSIDVPGLDGYSIHVEQPRFMGSLLAINAEVALSVRGTATRVGPYELGALPVGIQWWRNELTINSSNTELWGGENDTSGKYEPSKHPEFSMHGRLKAAKAPAMAAAVVPGLGLDVDGSSSLAFVLGYNADRTPFLSAHASLVGGRLGSTDLFKGTLASLAAADAALALPDADTIVAKPRIGSGARVDKLFFEVDKQGDVFDVGGVFFRAGEFQLDGDGRYSKAGGLQLEGVVAIPAAVTARLVASAPWLAPLRAGDVVHVPVVVGGTPASPTIALAPGYAELLARARRGEAVTPAPVRQVRHVGREGLAKIPGDPSTPVE